jgi:hypothetical protein
LLKALLMNKRKLKINLVTLRPLWLRIGKTLIRWRQPFGNHSKIKVYLKRLSKDWIKN